MLAELEAAGLRPRRALGQHFLVDDNLLRAIVEAAELGPDEGALEIGSGPGLLTRHLLPRVRRVWAVEVDARLLAVGRRICGPAPGLTVLGCDCLDRKEALSAELVRTLADGAAREGIVSVPLVSNLPYSVSVPVLLNLLVAARFGAVLPTGERRLLPVPRMVCMVQKEVALRLGAAPSTPEYGAVSVLTKALARFELLRSVPPGVFWPRPQVDSAVVRLVVRPPTEGPGFESPAAFESFRRLVRAAFGTRRKALPRALEVGGLSATERAEVLARLAELGVDPRTRGEALSAGQFLRLAGINPGPLL